MTELVEWSMDLGAYEQERVAAHLTATATAADLLAVHAAECRAQRMLYQGLSTEQKRVRRELQAAGILP